MLMNIDAVTFSVSISRELRAELEKTRASLDMDDDNFLRTLLSSYKHRQECSENVDRAMDRIHDLLAQAEKSVAKELLCVKERAMEIPSEIASDPETPAASPASPGDAPADLVAENQRLTRKLQEAEEACMRAKDDIQQLQTEVYLTENIHNQAIRTFRIEKEEELAEALKTAHRDCDNRVKFARAEERIIAEKEMAALRKQIENLTAALSKS